MEDPRIAKFADLLVQYCADVKPGELILVNSTPEAAPLVLAVYRAVLSASAHPLLRISLPGIQEIFYQQASSAQLDFISDVQSYESEHVQGSIMILAPANLRELAGIDPSRMARRSKAIEPLRKSYAKPREEGGVKWVGTNFPTNSLAQEAGMSLPAYEEFLFGACLPDLVDPVGYWKKVHQEQERIKGYLDRIDMLHFEGPNMDLTLRVKGRPWINCDGLSNMPDGEIFSAPLDDSARGWITFDYPSDYYGQAVEGVRLEFEEGNLVRYQAERGFDSLKAGVEIDEGSRRIGEISFGTNYGIQVSTRNTLFDEKIGGTIHLALGEAYAESGGINKSALHWDLVAEMKRGNRATADGHLFYENGRFLI